MKIRKITSLVLAILMICSVMCIHSYATDTQDNEQITPPNRSMIIASIIYRNFYYYSGSSVITLSQACEYVSFKVTTNPVSDTGMMAVIDDLSNGGTYNTTLYFDGNGSTTTYGVFFAPGSYRVTLYGDYSVLHKLALVAFST